MKVLRIVALTCLSVLVAACETTTPPATQIATVDPKVGPGSASVSAARAVDMFGTICAGSLPNFAKASAKISTNWQQASTGTWFSQTDDVSFRIVDGPASRKTCSFVFATTEPDSAVKAALASRGKATQSAFGYTVGFDQKAIAFLAGPSRALNGKLYFNLRMLSN